MVKRRFIGGVILCFALTTVIAVEPPTTAIIGTPPQPGWSQLNPLQKDILSPLSGAWDKMDNIHRKKWLGIADRYPGMKQTEQQRMQDRMREWADLTPDQRAKVRSSYKDFDQLPPEQKQLIKQKWDAYSNLSPEQQQRLREGSKSSKLLAAPADSTGPEPVTAPAATVDSSATADGSPTANRNSPSATKR